VTVVAEVRLPVDGQELLNEAIRRGADEAEMYLELARETEIEAYKGRVESAVVARTTGIALRVIRGGRLGFAYTTDTGPGAVRDALAAALATAEVTPADPHLALPDPAAPAVPEDEFYSADVEDTPVEEKAHLALEAERLALAGDPRISQVAETVYGDSCRVIAVRNSRGVNASFRVCNANLVVEAVAREGENLNTGTGFGTAGSVRALDVAAIAREAVEEATRLLGARPVPSVRVPVVLAPRVMAQFINIVGRALSALPVQRGRSMFAGRQNQQVASPLVEIVDDGLLPGGARSGPVDSEGVPSRRTVAVAGGRLQSFLYDMYTGRHDGVPSTGNGYRSSFRTVPEAAPTNIYLAAGAESLARIIGGVAAGLYVVDVTGITTGGANSISGDFSVGATGLWIEGGELTRPVREVTIAGNILELLRDIDGVADDLRFTNIMGFSGAPTVRVSSLAVSGSGQ